MSNIIFDRTHFFILMSNAIFCNEQCIVLYYSLIFQRAMRYFTLIIFVLMINVSNTFYHFKKLPIALFFTLGFCNCIKSCANFNFFFNLNNSIYTNILIVISYKYNFKIKNLFKI